MKKVTNTIKSASSIIAILAISAFSFNTFASEAESNKSYSCVETATENSCNLIITNPTAEDKKLVEIWKHNVEFSTCSVETDERIECNITAYYGDLENEASKEINNASLNANIAKNFLLEISSETTSSSQKDSGVFLKSSITKEMIRDALAVTLISFSAIMLAWLIILLSLRLYFALDLLLAYAIESYLYCILHWTHMKPSDRTYLNKANTGRNMIRIKYLMKLVKSYEAVKKLKASSFGKQEEQRIELTKDIFKAMVNEKPIESPVAVAIAKNLPNGLPLPYLQWLALLRAARPSPCPESSLPERPWPSS
uniref:Uncharacterized protein n=1 Tax=Rhizophagus irregularis (strain DAOM 181602 / DAOM 197198 / MUCL 43194) TaxID=747089 RepID=U9TAT9_RHIID